MCDMNSFIIYIKLEHSQKTNKHNVKEKYDASNYDVERPLPMRKKKCYWNDETCYGKNSYEANHRITKNIFVRHR